jgi:hypothetical protein
MKLNQELVKRLADGEIIYQHTGSDGQWAMIMRNAFPEDNSPIFPSADLYVKSLYHEIWNVYTNLGEMMRYGHDSSNLPIFTTEQFFEVETDTTGELQTERVFWECNPNENPYGEDETDHVPDVIKIDAETRELAKQLFIHNDNLTQAECIEFAIDFIKILNKHEEI